MANRRGFVRGIKPPQRQIASFAVAGNGTITFGAALIGTIAGSVGLALTVAAGTLVRTRGSFRPALAASGSNQNVISGAFGIIVVSSEAFTAGLASLPTPLADPERDWVVWQPFTLYGDGTAQGEAATGATLDFPFDSRGMRKMKTNDVMAPVFEAEQDDATSGTIINFAYTWRDQIKL